MPQAAIFDLDGTLLDSVDLHAIAWHEALAEFGHHATFEQVRSQIGKGGDKLIPAFLSPREQQQHGAELEAWRSRRFKSKYMSLIRPFSAVPDLLLRAREAGIRIAIASSAKRSEMEQYLEIAAISSLVDEATSSEDVEQSKPEPDVFESILQKLRIAGEHAIAIGDTPYDAEAAGKAHVPTIGVLCGGFKESELRKAGCLEIYRSPAALLGCIGKSLLMR